MPLEVFKPLIPAVLQTNALDGTATGTVHPCDTGDVEEVEMDGAFSV